jgi:hypothetical protein
LIEFIQTKYEKEAKKKDKNEKNEKKRNPYLNIFYNLLLTHLYFKGIYFSLACNIEAFFILYNYAFSPESQWWKILTYLLAVFTTFVILFCSFEFYDKVLNQLIFAKKYLYYRLPLKLKIS